MYGTTCTSWSSQRVLSNANARGMTGDQNGQLYATVGQIIIELLLHVCLITFNNQLQFTFILM